MVAVERSRSKTGGAENERREGAERLETGAEVCEDVDLGLEGCEEGGGGCWC